MPFPWKVPLAVLLSALVLSACGYLLGRHSAEQADWHTVTIDRSDVAGSGGEHRLLTVDVDGWAYGMQDAVPHWIDEGGAVHDSGWPRCLEPRHRGGTPERNRGEVTFRFASVEVQTDVVGWRPVVMVDCRR